MAVNKKSNVRWWAVALGVLVGVGNGWAESSSVAV